MTVPSDSAFPSSEASSSCASFPPSADGRARILILGSMPGGESLRRQEYYAFPRNAFWKIMGRVFRFDPELPYTERLLLLRDSGIALWDVLSGCERAGSLDSSIRNPVPNEIPELLKRCPEIRKILCNGSAAGGYLRKYFPVLSPLSETLPSTSPAAAMYSFEEKLSRWERAISIESFGNGRETWMRRDSQD